MLEIKMSNPLQRINSNLKHTDTEFHKSNNINIGKKDVCVIHYQLNTQSCLKELSMLDNTQLTSIASQSHFKFYSTKVVGNNIKF